MPLSAVGITVACQVYVASTVLCKYRCNYATVNDFCDENVISTLRIAAEVLCLCRRGQMGIVIGW